MPCLGARLFSYQTLSKHAPRRGSMCRRETSPEPARHCLLAKAAGAFVKIATTRQPRPLVLKLFAAIQKKQRAFPRLAVLLGTCHQNTRAKQNCSTWNIGPQAHRLPLKRRPVQKLTTRACGRGIFGPLRPIPFRLKRIPKPRRDAARDEMPISVPRGTIIAMSLPVLAPSALALNKKRSLPPSG